MFDSKDILKKLDKEIDKMLAKGELTKADWDGVYEAVDAYKDIVTICAMMGDDEGSSYRDGGSSYRGDRRYYPVSGMPDPEYRYQGNSYRDNSYHGDSFNGQLRRMMENATPEERAAAREMMGSMRY